MLIKPISTNEMSHPLPGISQQVWDNPQHPYQIDNELTSFQNPMSQTHSPPAWAQRSACCPCLILIVFGHVLQQTQCTTHLIVWPFDGLVQDCSISCALEIEIQQSCTKPSISSNGILSMLVMSAFPLLSSNRRDPYLSFSHSPTVQGTRALKHIWQVTL